MRSEAQYTIHTLNDVVTSTTAPSNPYLGQLWMDTSTNPPTEKSWNGSAWVEPNNIGTVKSTVTVLTEKSAQFATSIIEVIKKATGGSEKLLRFIPLIALGLGATSGVICFFFIPDIIPTPNVVVAIIVGAASELSATGTNQIVKQLNK